MTSFVAETASFAFQATLMVIALFFMLLHGDELLVYIDHVSPLKQGQTRELLWEFRRTSAAVLVSALASSGAQAAAALIGYWLAGVQNVFFFAALTFFVAFIPAVGATSVGLVVALFLYLGGHPGAAAFLAVWSVLVVSMIDNVLQPWLIKSGMKVNGAIIFFALLGGLLSLGTIGLLIGPLTVAVVAAMLRMYQRDFGRLSGAQAAAPAPADLIVNTS